MRDSRHHTGKVREQRLGAPRSGPHDGVRVARRVGRGHGEDVGSFGQRRCAAKRSRPIEGKRNAIGIDGHGREVSNRTGDAHPGLARHESISRSGEGEDRRLPVADDRPTRIGLCASGIRGRYRQAVCAFRQWDRGRVVVSCPRGRDSVDGDSCGRCVRHRAGHGDRRVARDEARCRCGDRERGGRDVCRRHADLDEARGLFG